MSDSTELDYVWLTQNAMRNVVREVLEITRDLGTLPGEHHFYIEFDTTHPGVEIADRLRTQYPERMTIVLQHQFGDLTIDAEQFSVMLQFKGVPETLLVPFAAVTHFADPSADFGLQFDVEHQAESKGPVTPEADQDDKPEPPDEPSPSGGADVVSLDRFRKK